MDFQRDWSYSRRHTWNCSATCANYNFTLLKCILLKKQPSPEEWPLLKYNLKQHDSQTDPNLWVTDTKFVYHLARSGSSLRRRPWFTWTADQLLADGLTQQCRHNRGSHTAAERQQHLFIPNLGFTGQSTPLPAPGRSSSPCSQDVCYFASSQPL